MLGCEKTAVQKGERMAGIPKNVMQIGQTDAHVEIYMEDYVHTFLERCGSGGACLAFGRKEESEGISYYLIYGVEKRQDWDRGSFPILRIWNASVRLRE